MEIAKHLVAAGAVVVGPARTLVDGIVAAATEEYDLALIDMNLVGLSAEPLYQMLKASGVPVVVATGYQDVDLPIPVLYKPIDPAMLISEIERALNTSANRPGPSVSPLAGTLPQE